MTITPKVWDFPTIPVEGQVFHVPGAVAEGGFTSGGAQIYSPEPGGFGVLEIEPSLHAGEWRAPFASWIMSKTNGQYFRIRLAVTPQIAWSQRRVNNIDPYWINGDTSGDAVTTFTATSLPGSSQVSVDVTNFGRVFRSGHLIGHGNHTYKIDDVQYVGNTAVITTTPPVRSLVTSGQTCYFRPFFIGRILNATEVVSMYRAVNNGAVQLGKIVFGEVIL